MLFNFQAFIEELRDKEDKKEVIEKYEKFYGSIQGNSKDQLWYKEYCSYFRSMPYLVPEELQPEFDWNLLLQLVASSFSSECIFEEPELKVGQEFQMTQDGHPLYDLTISVKSGDQTIIKKVSELWSFQLLRLYEIYVEEQMNLQILIAEDEKEKAAILSQRNARKLKWNKKTNKQSLCMELGIL